MFVPDLRPSRNRVFTSQLCASWLDLAEKRAGMVRDWSDVEQNLFQTWPSCLTMALVFQRIDQFLHSLCLLRGVILIQNKLIIQNISNPIFLLALQILPCGHGSKVGRRPYTTGYLPIRLANPWMKAHDLAISTCLRQVEQWKRRFPEMWLANGTTIFEWTWPSDGRRFDKIMLMFFIYFFVHIQSLFCVCAAEARSAEQTVEVGWCQIVREPFEFAPLQQAKSSPANWPSQNWPIAFEVASLDSRDWGRYHPCQEPISKLQAAESSVFASRWEQFTPYIAETWLKWCWLLPVPALSKVIRAVISAVGLVVTPLDLI